MKEIKMNEIVWQNTLSALGKIKTKDCDTLAEIAEGILPIMHLMMPPLSTEPVLQKTIDDQKTDIEKLKGEIEKLKPDKKE